MGVGEYLILRALQGLLKGSHLVRLLGHLLLQMRVSATHNISRL